LIENRLELAGRAVHELVERGYAAARHWADRRDPDNLVASFSDSEPGGFIHGDFKPGNILFDECGFSIIDWWTTPRVSWPLQDPAMLAANLRMGNRGAAARQVWNSFANAYFDARLDERTAAAIDLLATMTCLSFVAGKTRRGGGRLLDKRWCAKFVLALAEGQSILDSVR
jgi:Ser/Thr protein kinase RdoA (MazF antagonist)